MTTISTAPCRRVRDRCFWKFVSRGRIRAHDPSVADFPSRNQTLSATSAHESDNGKRQGSSDSFAPKQTLTSQAASLLFIR